ncbi:MAG: class I SAM-dependent RNA methyltransferase [Hyphomicrobiaceae bacterium]|nr:class I SAM-dependent RNA methyltransferase [Hyphomicrobiaceae bacterium]
MTSPDPFEIFLVSIPGLESVLCAEAREKVFRGARVIAGGVAFNGNWQDVWRANLELRGASRILARIGSFRVLHLAQLDKRAHRVAWRDILRPDVPFSVDAVCRSSRIYHSGAAAQRIARAITDEIGAPLSDEAEVVIKARIERDVCTLAVDTSGELLHRRGHKEAVNKAPMRETMASLLLRQCGYSGQEPVVDPMCGSGTFVIEAAEIARRLKPGRSRHFAFEKLATFDEEAWKLMRSQSRVVETPLRFFGSDRDAGAIRMSKANAERAGVGDIAQFQQQSVEELVAPDSPPGLVIINPPYGARIGDTSGLHALYRALGERLGSQFRGWRVGLVTTDLQLAQATRLPFAQPFGPVSHGGLRVLLFQTVPLA